MRHLGKTKITTNIERNVSADISEVQEGPLTHALSLHIKKYYPEFVGDREFDVMNNNKLVIQQTNG